MSRDCYGLGGEEWQSVDGFSECGQLFVLKLLRERQQRVVDTGPARIQVLYR